jgi:hypothetical protein
VAVADAAPDTKKPTTVTGTAKPTATTPPGTFTIPTIGVPSGFPTIPGIPTFPPPAKTL